MDKLYPDADGAWQFRATSSPTSWPRSRPTTTRRRSRLPGASTGSGGEIRDEGATGRGSKPKAGLAGFSVSNLEIPGFEQPWEQHLRQARAHRLGPRHHDRRPARRRAFNNEFGRPNLSGYFRTFEQSVQDEVRGYHKPIMIAGGLGSIQAEQSFKTSSSAPARC